MTQSSRWTTIAWISNFISDCQGAAGITKMKVMKATSAMPSPPQASYDIPQLNSRGLTSEPVMSKSVRVRMATMLILMRRRKHHKQMMHQHRMWRTAHIVGLSGEQVTSTGMSGSMATMRMRMRRNEHRKPIIDQRRMLRTSGILLDSVKIRLYISDL